MTERALICQPDNGFVRRVEHRLKFHRPLRDTYNFSIEIKIWRKWKDPSKLIFYGGKKEKEKKNKVNKASLINFNQYQPT